jgi:hypothetical protein
MAVMELRNKCTLATGEVWRVDVCLGKKVLGEATAILSQEMCGPYFVVPDDVADQCPPDKKIIMRKKGGEDWWPMPAGAFGRHHDLKKVHGFL